MKLHFFILDLLKVMFTYRQLITKGIVFWDHS